MNTNPTDAGNEQPVSDQEQGGFDLRYYDLDFSFNPLARDIHLFESKPAKIGKHWIQIDVDESSKVFTSPAATLHHVMKLDPCAKELFLWILYRLEYNTDLIKITEKRVSKDCGLKGNTFRKAIRGLVEAKIIARVSDSGRSTPESKTDDHWLFWINPHVMFKGGRYSHYRKNGMYNRESLISSYDQSEAFPPKS